MPELNDLPNPSPTPKENPGIQIGRIAKITKDRLDSPITRESVRGVVAYGTDEGVNYKPVNEDSIVVDTAHDAFAVIDGMGGMNHGTLASRILAEEILAGFIKGDDIQLCQKSASYRMKSKGVGNGGACYLAFKMTENSVYGWYAGDLQLAVLRNNGVAFVTQPENHPNKLAIVTNAVQGSSEGDTQRFKVSLVDGDRIIAASDGLWDNFTPEDVARQIAGLSTQDAISKLNSLAKEKMRSGGKPDNISVIIYDFSPGRRDPKTTSTSIPQGPDTESVLPYTTANSWEELEEAIRAGPGIQGSSDFFGPNDLIGIVRQVRRGTLPIESVTNAKGLRGVVRKLIARGNKPE